MAAHGRLLVPKIYRERAAHVPNQLVPAWGQKIRFKTGTCGATQRAARAVYWRSSSTGGSPHRAGELCKKGRPFEQKKKNSAILVTAVSMSR